MERLINDALVPDINKVFSMTALTDSVSLTFGYNVSKQEVLKDLENRVSELGGKLICVYDDDIYIIRGAVTISGRYVINVLSDKIGDAVMALNPPEDGVYYTIKTPVELEIKPECIPKVNTVFSLNDLNVCTCYQGTSNNHKEAIKQYCANNGFRLIYVAGNSLYVIVDRYSVHNKKLTLFADSYNVGYVIGRGGRNIDTLKKSLDLPNDIYIDVVEKGD